MKINLFLYLILFSVATQAQDVKHLYKVSFKDKHNSEFTPSNPELYISPKSILRRMNAKVEFNEQDVPISRFYLETLSSYNLKLVSKSKWLNCVIVELKDTTTVNDILHFSFVSAVEKLSTINLRGNVNDKFLSTISNANVDLSYHSNGGYGAAYNQISMMQGDYLHTKGFNGQGLTIAVLDAGFKKVNELEMFSDLRLRNGIVGVKDFVADADVYKEHQHGMNVLSVICGSLKDKYKGAAIEADFWLLRTEDANAEYLAEEYFWVEAAEFADSVGVDIIQSSLGYTTFDNSTENHTYADLNGKTTPISKGAGIAASKGILVVSSAGNSGQNSWGYISAPADNDSVLAIGAVDLNANRALFSSFGPSASGSTKPNVCAQGQNTAIAGLVNTVEYSSGTSFSSPLVAGLAACLWQAFPQKSSMEIFNAIQQSGSHYTVSDSLYGFGIPNFFKAYQILNENIPDENDPILNVYPNPFDGNLSFDFYSNITQTVNFKVYDFVGNIVVEEFQEFKENDYKTVSLNQLHHIPAGLYFVHITTSQYTFVEKVIKVAME